MRQTWAFRPGVVRAAWVGALILLILAPLVVAALAGPTPTSRRFWTEVSVALGFLGFSLILIQFALVSRLAPVSRPFGSDALMQWHRGMGLAALGFVVLHPLLLSGVPWSAWNPFSGSVVMQTGAVAFWATVLVVATSVWRRRLRLSYEAWQIAHLMLACLITVAATWHIVAAGFYSRTPAVRWVLVGYVALFAVLLLRYRLIRPLVLLRRPWTIEANRDIGGSVRLLRVRPDGHAGLRFEAGQFGWLVTGSNTVISQQHPLSFASSAVPASDGAVEFAVKNLGDWSGQVVPALTPGQRVWVDGPFGAFTPDVSAPRGLVLIAGGIGIAPMRSVLLTLRDAGHQRPVWLFHAASNWSRVVFRDDIAALASGLDMRVCYVFEHPDAEWTGERGRITRDVLERHLPPDRRALDYFVCGPVAMMDAVEACLTDMGVPARQVHTERFQMV
jgi:predicted ferric reductase